jgi:diaminopimelate epimerase
MGNPHAVFFVKDASAIALAEVGPLIECHTIFPERVNVSFAQIMDRNHIIMCVWERSAGATLACGSAACATLVASVRAGLSERQARISLPGGDLSIAWREVDDHVIMSGDVELEYEGMLPARLMASAA